MMKWQLKMGSSVWQIEAEREEAVYVLLATFVFVYAFTDRPRVCE